jgi:UDP-N-acetylglucosamine diphosphorylase/glucosamine-1-phosphate N-acetyltransferase
MEGLMRLCLVEDNTVVGLEPLTLTRPVFDLLLGASTLGGKIARAFGIGSGPARRGAVVRPYLAAVQQARDPHTAVNDRDWLARGPVLVVNARWVPPADVEIPAASAPSLGLCDGRPAWALVGPEQAVSLEPNGVDDWFESQVARIGGHEVGGEWIERPWDIVAKNAAHLIRDFAVSGKVGVSNRHLSTAALIGPANRLSVHESARIDPYTVFDTTNGPITVAAGAIVKPFTHIEGPCYIGSETQLFRATLRAGVTLGPNCRIGGEVEATIVQGRSNKYHEGFLGHSYIGEWVNLGAITSNSDLRNDYGEVFVPLGGDPVGTGQAKVGCFIGDYTRTGLGSMINTGTAIGVMCNLLPAGPLLPKHVPSFASVLYGRVAPGFPLDQMFATARTVLGRRGQEFTEVEEQLYEDLFEQTKLERERAWQRANDRDRRGEFWPTIARSSVNGGQGIGV